MTHVDIQLSPANTEWPRLRAATVEAERRGYEAVHVFDHLAGLPLGGSTMLECWALLGALCEVTERVELGTMVANVWNRQVGTLVSAAASIGIMSGRRVQLGVGAGASPTSSWAAEHRAVGAHLEPDLATRHDRVEAVLHLAAEAWAADPREELRTLPRPPIRPITIVGVNSIRLSRLAGRCADGVNVPWRHPRRDDFLAAAVDEAGDRPFLRTTYTTYAAELLDPDHHERRAMSARGIDRLVLAVFDDLETWYVDDVPVAASG